MPLWTLLGLLEGKQTTPWPLEEGKDGQAGLLGMPRYHPELCAQGCEACAEVCPTEAISLRAKADKEEGRLSVDYGRCVVCQLCTEACPTGAMSPSQDWAFGVRHKDDLVWRPHPKSHKSRTKDSQTSVQAQPAYSPRRLRLLQWLRVGAPGSEQSLL